MYWALWEWGTNFLSKILQLILNIICSHCTENVIYQNPLTTCIIIMVPRVLATSRDSTTRRDMLERHRSVSYWLFNRDTLSTFCKPESIFKKNIGQVDRHNINLSYLCLFPGHGILFLCFLWYVFKLFFISIREKRIFFYCTPFINTTVKKIFCYIFAYFQRGSNVLSSEFSIHWLCGITCFPLAPFTS